MAKFGIPKIVFSDNAPQFSSAEFLSFAKFYNFQSRTSSPEYLQSNGRAEQALQTAKRLIKSRRKQRKSSFSIASLQSYTSRMCQITSRVILRSSSANYISKCSASPKCKAERKEKEDEKVLLPVC